MQARPGNILIIFALIFVSNQSKGSEFQVPTEKVSRILEAGSGASPIVKFDAEMFSDHIGGPCMGTFITNEGHFLTALHCIKGCLRWGGTKNNEHFGALSISNTTIPSKKFGMLAVSMARINREMARQIVCNLGPFNAQIVAIGAKGYVESFDTSLTEIYLENPTLHSKLIANEYDGEGGSNDFAVLKTTENRRNGYSCLKLGSRALPKFANISYPFQRQRRIPLDGMKPLLTYGQVKTEHTSEFGENGLDRQKGLQQLSLDSAPGSSGSSYFDKEGNIGGIIVMGLPRKTEHKSPWEFFDGNTVGISSSHILENLRNQLDEDSMKNITTGCRLTNHSEEILQGW